LLGRGRTPESLGLPVSKDATDALAIAICHLHSSRLAARIQEIKEQGTGGRGQERNRLLRSAFMRRTRPRTLPAALRANS
jgi:hypothetical protein